MEIYDAKDLRYENEIGTVISAQVLVTGIDVWGPYVMGRDDVVEHSRKAWADAVAGRWGPVAEYVPRPITNEILCEQLRTIRDMKLIALDKLVCNPIRWDEFSAEMKQNFIQYRKDLLDVPQQGGFPVDAVWPNSPEF